MFCSIKFSGAVCALLLLTLSGCSKSTAPESTEELGLTAFEDSDIIEPIPYTLDRLRDSDELISELPVIISSEPLAQSGLQVAYTHESQFEAASGLLVEANWLHMQSCLNQVSVAPIVLILDSAVSPLTADDIVTYSIQGIPVASATMGDIPIVQVSDTDFSEGGDNSGYQLRSIMGRLLWSSAGLAVRDYSFECARQAVLFP